MSADQNLSTHSKYTLKKKLLQYHNLNNRLKTLNDGQHHFTHSQYHFIFTPPLQRLCSPTFSGVLVVKHSEHAYVVVVEVTSTHFWQCLAVLQTKASGV